MIGVKFDSKHSYDDFGLILSSKSVPLPKPKTESVTVPGSDGELDLSTALTDGEVKFNNRTLTFKFSLLTKSRTWEGIKSAISNYLHGKKMKIILDVDKAFYYVGRCTVDPFSESKKGATMTIKVDAEPYKYDIQDSTEDWVWDSFNFETGIIYNLKEISVTPSTEIIIPSRRMKVVPVITVSSAMDVVFNGVTYGLSEGDNRVLSIIFSEGENKLTFSGTGTVTIKFRGGSL